jgi:hypothetical protein
MRKAFLIYEEMRKYFPIYEEAISPYMRSRYMTLQLLHSEFLFISVAAAKTDRNNLSKQKIPLAFPLRLVIDIVNQTILKLLMYTCCLCGVGRNDFDAGKSISRAIRRGRP